MSKKILITGANGFTGRALKKFLSKSHCVIAAGREELDLLDKNKVAETLAKEKFDIVIHTAIYDAAPEFSTKDPDKVLEYNLRMFDNLASCNEQYRAMIYFGSGAEKKKEKPYGLSKNIMNQMAQNKNNIYNLRLYSVYGIGTDWRYRFINNACAKIALDMPIKVPRINKCDYLHINDLCQVVKFYVESYKYLPKSSDICSGDVFTPDEIIEHIKEVALVKDVIPHNTVTTTVSRSQSSEQEYYGDPGLLKLLPIHTTPISAGIRELIEYYKKKQPDPNQFVY
jgi:nucleoside-diphosphate-sugar epimerase